MVATRRSNSVDNPSVLQDKSSVEKNANNSTPLSKTRVRRMVSSGTKRNIFMDHSDDIHHQVRSSSRRPRATARPISPSSEEMDDHEEAPRLRSLRTRSSNVSIRYHTRRIATSRRLRGLSPDHDDLPQRSQRRRKSRYATLDEDADMEILGGDIIDESIRAENNSAEKNLSDGMNKAKRKELRELLAMQGKDLSDMKSYMEPDIYSSVKSRKRASTRNRLYGEYYTATAQKRTRHGQEEEGEARSSDEDDHGEEEDEHTNEENEEREEEEDEEESENDSDEEEEEGEENDEDGHKYQLRKVREAPQRYTIVQDAQPRRSRSLFETLPCSPVRRRHKKVSGSSDHNPYQKRRRRSRAQANSSTSTDSSDDDELKFRKRQQRSMAKARNLCMPINMTGADAANHSFARDRKKIGNSLADIDPMALDTSVKFSSVGGHNKHIRALKEMIVFPLLYPEVFTKFSIAPPRGCLFYGPPGTGKTLMARALANECSTDGKKVSFFMKKGADCLSKWIGESERQLRLLFDQAYQMRPSIIFFDEIDGLAPVRSTRQDQIHSSIVSTLLALMDGLDSRGEIVVIGATNRIDSIDPALRRPGRFDREFLFPLPDKEAREQILKIHTGAWDPPLKPSYIGYLATKTVGYCGADLKALCTEAALFALRRRYPQIYKSSDKLQLDVNSIKISGNDFLGAIKNIIPTAERSASRSGRALHSTMKPLLDKALSEMVSQLAQVFPVLRGKSKILKEKGNENGEASSGQLSDEESDIETSTFVDGIYVGETEMSSHLTAAMPGIPSTSNGIVQPQYTSLIQRLSAAEHSLSTVHRPRFMVCGNSSTGHISHLTPALIHDMEGIPVHTIDLPSLYGVSVRTPEESCAHVFREARRVTPSIIYVPDAVHWWNVASPTVLATLESLLHDIPPHSPILLLATANCKYSKLPRRLAKFFHSDFCEVFETSIHITTDQRRDFFAPIFLVHACTPPPHNRSRTSRLEVLEKAPTPEPVPLTEQEERKLVKDEESTLRNLRLFLRDVIMRLMRDRRFKIFAKPVDFEEVPDYMEVIKNPMDLSTILTKIDQHKYQTVAQFLDDVDLICNNALEYNPDRRPEDKLIRHRACTMRDMAHAIVDQDLDPDFEKLCHDIVESRKRRGLDPAKYAPRFYPVLPKHLMIHPISGEVVPKTAEGSPDECSGAKNPDEVESESGGRPWKLPPKKTPIPSRHKRKRSSWSRGVVPSKKKKKVVIEEEDEEEEGEEEEGEEGEEEEEEEEEKKDDSSEQEDDSHDQVPVIDDDDDHDGAEENGEASTGTSEEGSPHVENPVKDDDEDEEDEGEEEEEEGDEEEEENEEKDVEKSPVSSRGNADDRFHGTENGDEAHVGRDLANLFDQADQLLKQKEKGVDHNNDTNGVGEPLQNGLDVAVKEEMDASERSSTSRGSTPPVATIYPDLDAAENDEEDSSEKKQGEEATEEQMEEDVHVEDEKPRRMMLRSHDKPTSDANSGSNKIVLEEERPPTPPPPPPFIVDRKELIMLLEAVVVVTSSFSVEELERIYSALSRCVHRHRMSYDRTRLQEDLKAEVTGISSLSASREDSP